MNTTCSKQPTNDHQGQKTIYHGLVKPHVIMHNHMRLLNQRTNKREIRSVVCPEIGQLFSIGHQVWPEIGQLFSTGNRTIICQCPTSVPAGNLIYSMRFLLLYFFHSLFLYLLFASLLNPLSLSLFV